MSNRTLTISYSTAFIHKVAGLACRVTHGEKIAMGTWEAQLDGDPWEKAGSLPADTQLPSPPVTCFPHLRLLRTRFHWISPA